MTNNTYDICVEKTELELMIKGSLERETCTPNFFALLHGNGYCHSPRGEPAIRGDLPNVAVRNDKS